MNGKLDGSLARRLANAHIGILLFLIISIFVTASDLRAQVAGATMSGTVTDPSGGFIPGAALSIKNVATGIGRQIITDASGVYNATNLQPGTYEVTVSAAGFATTVRSGVTLNVVDFSFRWGR